MTRRILVVDDEPAQLKLSRRFLEDAGFAVEVAACADAAIRSARRRRPSLIVSDVVMGEVDGFGLCRKLRDDDQLARIPVVLVSSHCTATDAGVARALGATTLIERTPDFSAELTAVRACLTTRSLRPRRSPDSYEQQVRANVNQVSQLSTRIRVVDARCRLVFEHAADAMAIVAPNKELIERSGSAGPRSNAERCGGLIDANRRWTELFGARLDDDGAVAALVRRGNARATVALRAPDGTTVHVELTASTIEMDAGPAVLVVGREPIADDVAIAVTGSGGIAVHGGDETVLLVEDDPAVSGVNARILREREYTVLAAGRSSDALALAVEHAGDIDAIVSDVVMPGANDSAIVASLRGVVPDAGVLLMSGRVDHPLLRGVHAADPEFLAKPFTPARLAAAVRDLLDRRPVNPAVKS